MEDTSGGRIDPSLRMRRHICIYLRMWIQEDAGRLQVSPVGPEKRRTHHTQEERMRKRVTEREEKQLEGMWEQK